MKQEHNAFRLLAAIHGKAVEKTRTGTKEEKVFAKEIIDMIAQPFDAIKEQSWATAAD